MIQEIVENIVGTMTANGDKFSFLHSERDWQNLESDEITLPAVYLDMPIKYTPKTMNGGGIQLSYVCMILFLYKSELDDSPQTKYNTMIKCMAAQREFQILLDNSEAVKSFTVGECYQIMNLFDANLDGIAMPSSIVPSEWPSICV